MNTLLNLYLKRFSAVMLLVLLFTVSTYASASVIYVKSGAPAGGNGSSWQKAYNNLDAALSKAAASNDLTQIWVTKGVYIPATPYSSGTYLLHNPSSPQLNTFKLPSNVAIYGGFAGTESSISQRVKNMNASANQTILDGYLNGYIPCSSGDKTCTAPSGTPGPQVWHVLTADCATNVTLDGLVVKGGNANGPDAGGMSDGTVFNGVTYNDVLFDIVYLDYVHNNGGGLLVFSSSPIDTTSISYPLPAPFNTVPIPTASSGHPACMSSVALNNMAFEDNTASAGGDVLRDFRFGAVIGPLSGPGLATSGGGIAAVGSQCPLDATHPYGIHACPAEATVTVQNSTFNGNACVNGGCDGGAIGALLGGSVTVSQSTFTNNQSDRFGGALRAKQAAASAVYNSSFTNNIITGAAVGDESGGAIGIIDTSFTLKDSSFTSNSTNTAAGGAMLVHYPFQQQVVYNLDVENSVFTENIAGFLTGGGAIAVIGGGSIPGTSVVQSNVSIKDDVFTNNNAQGEGGALFIDSVPTTIENSLFNGNTVFYTGGSIFATNFSDAIFAFGPDPHNASIFDNPSLLPPTGNPFRPLIKVVNSIFIDNGVVPHTPPVFAFTAAHNAFSQIAGVLSFVFNINEPPAAVTSLYSGGGAISASAGANLAISNSLFLGNTAHNAGNLTIDCLSQAPNCFSSPTTAYGGALLIGGSSGVPNEMSQTYVKISNSICLGNVADSQPYYNPVNPVNVGNNNAVIDPAALGSSVTGVMFDTDRSCKN